MPLLILIALFVVSCGPPARVAQATTCREQGNAITMTAATCREAVASLERLVERSPECAAILNDDAGARVHCNGDGGVHDGGP